LFLWKCRPIIFNDDARKRATVHVKMAWKV
jgi:hypothetical protein